MSGERDDINNNLIETERKGDRDPEKNKINMRLREISEANINDDTYKQELLRLKEQLGEGQDPFQERIKRIQNTIASINSAKEGRRDTAALQTLQELVNQLNNSKKQLDTLLKGGVSGDALTKFNNNIKEIDRQIREMDTKYGNTLEMNPATQQKGPVAELFKNLVNNTKNKTFNAGELEALCKKTYKDMIMGSSDPHNVFTADGKLKVPPGSSPELEAVVRDLNADLNSDFMRGIHEDRKNRINDMEKNLNNMKSGFKPSLMDMFAGSTIGRQMGLSPDPKYIQIKDLEKSIEQLKVEDPQHKSHQHHKFSEKMSELAGKLHKRREHHHRDHSHGEVHHAKTDHATQHQDQHKAFKQNLENVKKAEQRAEAAQQETTQQEKPKTGPPNR